MAKLGFFLTTSEAETQLEQYLSDGRGRTPGNLAWSLVP
jgi:hypothetical protein